MVADPQITVNEEGPSRFVVGVDLGTTNSALCYVDTLDSSSSAPVIHCFPVSQLIAAGQLETRETLPSFHFEPAAGQDPKLWRLPWTRQSPGYVVGVMAREQGVLTPGRVIGSAKSWLCHSGVDRTAKLLPWHAADDVERLSPVEASSRYLRHLRDAWNAHFRQDPLEEQDLVLTLPASFDEIARELTVEAARAAGLPRVVLIEEPQAAFYSWLHRHARDWTQRISAGQRILVCDIGGGTTDFTLIHVEPGDQPAAPVKLHRVAVGDHLILGGDNLDLALAQQLESRLSGGGQLPPRQWDQLWRQCRAVKETIFGEHPPARLQVHVAAEGSRLVGGGQQVEVDCAAAAESLLDGFFPLTELSASPQQQAAGFREFGLPFAADAAITRYLAEFLRRHPRTAGAAVSAADVRPDVVLFNGGVFASPRIRQRLLEVLQHWFASADRPWRPLVLDHDRLDLAVARGAAYYGLVRRGAGVRINAGLARSYYVGLAGEPPTAVCLAPGGIEPGQDIELGQRRFELAINRPVQFPLYSSSVRLSDHAGQVVAVDHEQLRPLAPLCTVLQGRWAKQQESLEVTLGARTTEIGTLEMWCRSPQDQRSWRLQFDVRAATQTQHQSVVTSGEGEGLLDEAAWVGCREQLHATFGGAGSAAGLMKKLAQALELEKQQWPPTLLRRIWEELMALPEGRRLSAAHEARWLNLLGYSLRPGYGVALDDWRVEESWRLLQGKLVHGSAECRAESWILWRRIAGGLAAGRQQALADPLLRSLRQLHRRVSRASAGGKAGFNFSPHEAAEMWRLLGALERLPMKSKVELGDMLANLFDQPKAQSMRSGILWALARVGARQPVYGLLSDVAPREKVQQWLTALVATPTPDAAVALAVAQLARRTDDRYRDPDPPTRQQAVQWLAEHHADSAWVRLVEQAGALNQHQQQQVLGDDLPVGLQMIS